MDKHGNVKATEGCDRCDCGSKYWENDLCIDCGEPVDMAIYNRLVSQAGME